MNTGRLKTGNVLKPNFKEFGFWPVVYFDQPTHAGMLKMKTKIIKKYFFIMCTRRSCKYLKNKCQVCIKKISYRLDEKVLFMIFDQANVCASMYLLVEIHNNDPCYGKCHVKNQAFRKPNTQCSIIQALSTNTPPDPYICYSNGCVCYSPHGLITKYTSIIRKRDL